jgi:ribonuclease HII
MKKNTLSIPDFYEHTAWNLSQLVCGVDEVGRGCLAGPVVAAAVILPAHTQQIFKDSKKMTARGREKAYDWIINNAAYASAAADHDYITTHNIYQATLFAMRQAVTLLATQYPALFARTHTITVDAMPLTLPALAQHPKIASFIKGEDYSRSIAAASIVAKVTRDRLIAAMAPLFPAYTFASDKSYATAAHCQALKQSPATFIHRKEFIKTVRAQSPKKEELL